MKIRIALLGYENFVKRAETYIKYLKNVEIVMYSSFGYESLSLIDKLEQKGIDAIVTGQTNYIQLKDKTDIPIIPFRVTYVDAIKALKQALAHGVSTVALLYPSFDDFEFNFKALADFIGLNLIQLSYKSIGDLENKIIDLKEHGIKTLIGTTLAASMCSKYEINGIEIYSIEDIVHSSIDKAIEVVKVIRENKSKEILQNHIINYVHEGIVCIDELGKIRIFNDEAIKLCNLENNHVIGKHIDGIIPELKLTDVLITGKAEIDFIEKIKGVQLSINRIPINIGNKTMGVISTFQNTERIEEINQAIKRNKRMDGFVAKYSFKDIIGNDPKFLEVIDLSKKFAKSDLPILVEGETGTGKELFVQSIHNYSDRKNNPFVAINCASLPDNLLESELFGYEPGSFTGASSYGKKGLFEVADGGTLFLDEINSISKSFQAKLLRVIEEREIIRIGGKKIIPIDVRIISSSNVKIKSLIRSNNFREDLYYRIGTLKVKIPPLRDRIGDLPYLIKALCDEMNPYKKYDFQYIYLRIWNKLLSYNFPGNIRELKTFLQRFFILIDENSINNINYIDNLIDFCRDEMFEEVDRDLYSRESQDVLKDNEKDVILTLLEKYNNNKSLVAKHLGIGRNTLYRKLKKYGIYESK